MSIFDEDVQLDAIDDTIEQHQNSKYFINAVDNVCDLNNTKFTYNGQTVYVKNENCLFCKMEEKWEKIGYVNI